MKTHVFITYPHLLRKIYCIWNSSWYDIFNLTMSPGCSMVTSLMSMVQLPVREGWIFSFPPRPYWLCNSPILIPRGIKGMEREAKRLLLRLRALPPQTYMTFKAWYLGTERHYLTCIFNEIWEMKVIRGVILLLSIIFVCKIAHDIFVIFVVLQNGMHVSRFVSGLWHTHVISSIQTAHIRPIQRFWH